MVDGIIRQLETKLCNRCSNFAHLDQMLRTQVEKVYAIACWKWKCSGDSCSICTDKLEYSCPQCRKPGDGCPPAHGTCGHSFHLHCIEQWLSQRQHQEHGGPSNNTCPMCRRPFIFT